MACSSLAVQFTVGTFGIAEGSIEVVLGVLHDVVVVVVVLVKEIHVLTDGKSGTGTLIIWGFTIGPQAGLFFLNSSNHSCYGKVESTPILKYTSALKHTIKTSKITCSALRSATTGWYT